MSFQYNGVQVETLKKLWPIITAHLSFRLDTGENVADISKLQAIIRRCCDHQPANFDEYISYVMIATIMELLKFPATQFHQQSTQLMVHTFNADTKQWYRDEKKVMAVAEAIWMVSSDSSNINHIIIEIQHHSMFTFNVSMVLMIAVLGNLTTKVKSNKLPLVKPNAIFEQVGKLDIMKNSGDKKILFDFLYLFQTFQLLIITSAARDDSLKNVLSIQPNQLERLKSQLQTILQTLNRRITDQADLNENTTISHCIQFILNNMDNIDINLL